MGKTSSLSGCSVLLLLSAVACHDTQRTAQRANAANAADAQVTSPPTSDDSTENSMAREPPASAPASDASTEAHAAASEPSAGSDAQGVGGAADSEPVSMDDAGSSASVGPSAGANATQDPEATANSTPEAGAELVPDDAAVAPKPEPRAPLVTSSQGAFWVISEPTDAPDAGSANVVVDTEAPLQTWNGFGGSFEEWGWEALQRLEPSERQRAMRLLFDVNEGAHFAWGRLPIGASDFAIERYSLADVEDDYALEHFSIERDELRLIPYLEAALAVNPELRLLATPWSPPAWMKDNASMDRGGLRNEEPVMRSYAMYLARYVEAYAERGFDIEALHVQNDLTWVEDSPSCEWDASTLTSFVRDFLGPTFLERAVPAELWLGEFGVLEDVPVLDTVLADPNVASFVSGISLSWDTWSRIPALADYGLPVMQTRHEPGNSPWLNGFDSEDAPNDYAYALHSWDVLYDWITSGVNGYLAWNMVLDEHDEGLNALRLWPKNTLLRVDPETNTLVITPVYYVFRHLSHYVDPGAVRLSVVASEVQALSFENPDGSIAVVVHNPSAERVQITVAVADARPSFELPAKGWATLLLE